MKRTESIALHEHFDRVRRAGNATECIREHCLSWWYCSLGGRIVPPVCDADLSTGFYHKIAEEEHMAPGPVVAYRDPDKIGHSGVFKKKKKKRY